ncbi:hypothetical protein DFS34DRAFT_681867 [Phlyctochytrium arcticum]|nr:hypothetical protein DFS34DRAFT_681867 [Phlyctochytrium arcticum]
MDSRPDGAEPPEDGGTLVTPRAARTLQNQTDMQNAAQLVQARRIVNMPKNTAAAYAGKQKRWAQWCLGARDFEDGVLVTAEKLVLYLEEEVLAKGNQHAAKKRKAASTQPTVTEGSSTSSTQVVTIVPIGHSTLEGHVSAMVSLWNHQKATGQSSESTPRDYNVSSLLTNALRETNERERLAYVSKAKGSPIAGYNKGELRSLSDHWFVDQRESIWAEGLRNRAGWLLQHVTFARGESIRFLQLSDLWSYQPNDIEGCTWWALGITS